MRSSTATQPWAVNKCTHHKGSNIHTATSMFRTVEPVYSGHCLRQPHLLKHPAYSITGSFGRGFYKHNCEHFSVRLQSARSDHHFTLSMDTLGAPNVCASCSNLALFFVVLTAAAVAIHCILGGQLALQLLWGFLLRMALVVEILLQLKKREGG